jgi:hypothetical protein
MESKTKEAIQKQADEMRKRDEAVKKLATKFEEATRRLEYLEKRLKEKHRG